MLGSYKRGVASEGGVYVRRYGSYGRYLINGFRLRMRRISYVTPRSVVLRVRSVSYPAPVRVCLSSAASSYSDTLNSRSCAMGTATGSAYSSFLMGGVSVISGRLTAGISGGMMASLKYRGIRLNVPGNG